MTIASRMSGKTIIVTGAGAGIGRAIAHRFIEEGAWVACVDIDETCAKSAAEEFGENAMAIVADVSKESDVEAAIQLVLSKRDGIDVLINNAGIAGPQTSVLSTSIEDWKKTIAINLDGTFLFSKHSVSSLTSRRGNIVNIASALALVGWRDECAYGPSKAAVVQLTKSMALDFSDSIRVNCVCPGAVHTPMIESFLQESEKPEEAMKEYASIHPLHGRLAQPREIADAVLFLASNDASLITGVALAVDAGFTAG